ncbi:MAG: NERD domain-containing protein [Clostridia bacterium]|nr:NERD domain-containing protein [Clostridia bacterium]
MGLFDKLRQPVFLKAESDTAEYIKRLNTLSGKTSGDLKEKIEKEIKLATFGEIGEQNIAFELKNAGIPMYILHDIYLEHNDLSAQIDYIVITRKLTFIIECKNLIGNIEIDNNGNFIRTYEFNRKKYKEGIYSPITQNERHLEVIKQIKRDNKNSIITKMLFDKAFYDFHNTVVVLANPKTILSAKFAKKEIKNQVIRADQLINYIKRKISESRESSLNDKDMLDKAEKFLKLHIPNKTDYAKKYEEIVSSMETDVIEEKKEKQVFNEEKAKIVKSEKEKALPNKTKEELIIKLKAYRLQKCREEQIKPYYIFNDKQMEELIQKNPSTKEELMNVTGFGAVKVEKYGEMIISILKGE